MSNGLLAICPFCGQMYSSKYENATEDMLHKEAVLQCNCFDAKQQAAKWELIDDTKVQLKKFFRNESPDSLLDAQVIEDLRQYIENFITYLADGKIKSVSVDINGIGKLTLTYKDSRIKIKKQTVAEVVRRY